MEDKDQERLNELLLDFRSHEKVCEERWKTVYNEIRSAKDNSEKDRTEIKASILSIQRLIWTGGGALIILLAGSLMTQIGG